MKSLISIAACHLLHGLHAAKTPLATDKKGSRIEYALGATMKSFTGTIVASGSRSGV